MIPQTQKFIEMLQSFVSGEDRSIAFSKEMVGFLIENFPEDELLEDLIVTLDLYHPGGGEYLYDEAQMTDICKNYLYTLTRESILQIGLEENFFEILTGKFYRRVRDEAEAKALSYSSEDLSEELEQYIRKYEECHRIVTQTHRINRIGTFWIDLAFQYGRTDAYTRTYIRNLNQRGLRIREQEERTMQLYQEIFDLYRD